MYSIETLRKNLKYLRKSRQLSMEALAKKLGLGGKTTIQAYEDGRAEPRLETLCKMSRIYKVRLDKLLLKKLYN